MFGEIIEDFKEYFNGTSIYIDMKSTNEKIIRLGCTKTKIYLNLYWQHILNYVLEKNSFEAIQSYIYSDGSVKKMHYIEMLFASISNEDLYSPSNKQFWIWCYKLHSFNDRYINGFYKNYYAEFSIQTKAKVNIEKLIKKFRIGNVEINISYPSDFYRLIFQSTKIDLSFKEGWKQDITISLCKDNKVSFNSNEIEKYLQQALFILDLYFPKIFVFGISNNDYIDSDIYYESKDIEEVYESKHVEPIFYYNEGVNSTKETAFYYFYKVLEFYFDNNIKDRVKDDLKKVKNSKTLFTDDDLDDLADNIIKVSNGNKEKKLINLLENENIISAIDCIIYSRENREDAIYYFAKKLYRYRNSLIHSEDNDRLLPQLLKSYKDNLSIREWNEIIKGIALVCIDYFSYDKKLLSDSVIWW